MTEVLKKILYKGVVPVIGGFMFACMAIASDTDTQAHLRELARGRAMTDRYKSNLMTPTPEPNIMGADEQLGNLVVVVQEIMQYGWNVTSISTDGKIEVQGNRVVWECGVLDHTPVDKLDNEYPQFSDVQSIAEHLQVALPDKTLVIWEREMGYMSEGGAERVDTKSIVLACPKVVVSE